MSRIMLHGALNCPVKQDDVIAFTQLVNRAKEASEVIYKQDEYLERINMIVWEKFMVIDRNPKTEDALSILAILEQWAKET